MMKSVFYIGTIFLIFMGYYLFSKREDVKLQNTRSSLKVKFYKVNESMIDRNFGNYGIDIEKQSNIDIVSNKENIQKNREWEDEIDEFSSQYKRVTTTWRHKVKELFLNEFYLTEKDFQVYTNIINKYEEEKMDSYGKFYDETKNDNDEYTKNKLTTSSKLSEEFEGLIKEKYNKKIKESIGSENYLRYKEVLEEFNNIQKENIRDQSPQVILDF